MSRRLPALFLLVPIGPLAAVAQTGLPQEPTALPQPGTSEAPTLVTADAAMAMDRARMRELVSLDCPRGREGEDEVIVCGRRQGVQRYRVPMSAPDLGPGSRERAGGEQLAAMDAGNTRCSAVGRDQMCGGGLDVFAIGFAIIRGIRQALANRD